MRLQVLTALTALPLLVGCGATTSSYVQAEDTTLGRVVLYRNGVAYFERTADVKDDTLRLSVPADKVDDFLKSLTVVDAKTGKPAPIAYPTDAPRSGGIVDMKIRLPDNTPRKLRLSYVTEAPAWKPSYRIVIGDGGKVELQGWAIIDNTSGEDWNKVLVGVGSSSALSFRYDLRSIRTVQRETLQSDGVFALAPPTGGSPFDNSKTPSAVFDFADDALAGEITTAPVAKAQKPAPPAAYGGRRAPSQEPPMAPSRDSGASKDSIASLANALRNSNGGQVIVEGYASTADGDKKGAALDRANKLRQQLVQNGVDPSRVVAVARPDVVQSRGGARVVEQAAGTKATDKTQTAPEPASALDGDPIGTSHFESGATMTVPKASSAMVSILSTKTEGGVVYLYDAESARGNANFAFKSVRLVNPTDSVLESGPVTVFGQGRFIGEGLSEPIPARSAAFVPFALDKQIVVERKDAERDEIARVLTVQRGVFSTEVKHLRRAEYAITNRLGERATVFIRHTVGKGFEIEKAPEARERLGASHLFRVELEPKASKTVVIETATPVTKSLDLRSPTGFETVRAYLSSSATGMLKERVGELVKFQTEIANVEQKIETLRQQQGEHRARLDELHAQIVTLRAVKTAGPLMQSLEKKMQETSDRVSKVTIDIVGQEEARMVLRVKFQDAVAELSLDDKERPSKP
jgi:hypothetical protein